METKKCTLCGKVLPIEDFPIRTVRGKKVRRPRCRTCHNKDSSEWQSNNYHRHWANATLKNHNKKYIVSITRTELTERAKTTTYCELCGKELIWNTGKKHISHNSPTLDRKNNEQHMTLDNTLIICNACNKAKSNMKFDEFINMCKRIVIRWDNVS